MDILIEYLPLLRVSGINWCQASYLYHVNSVALKQEMSQLTADNFLIPYRHKTQPFYRGFNTPQ